ncbi:exonuclease II Exo2 [Coemansia guatemalensis]|uniref:Exonuclease II Exo2 n=1 Tax=Coemansia guatemalensis TaxID=2761395 RepID=A0A9W8HUY3_9FUNG|nr:exonuclease II Exo2 [Coemansia guatemalensis]
MGIPKFFRWLSGRYPLVCERVSDNNIPEFDNLYLDMNGIIHNCTHPKDGEAPAPATDEERFLAIFNYIDFLFNKVRPCKVFFLGIDGVAPRAKMNEQRARRFRTAKELEEQRGKELRQRRANGEAVRAEDAEDNDDVFDPTCITPGTEFMDRLTEALRYYINKRVSEDADWRRPKIILSAPNVPGEGEHKIMDYIRFSRAQPGYRANTRHCLYGLDADLIMLGLLSHEPHFSLLREEVLFGASARKGGASADPAMQGFYLLHISILRDYLDHEFGSLKTALGCSSQYRAMEKGQPAKAEPTDADANTYDLERIIDDYVLMSMLVGNDFLPNLPKLSINGGALNFMFAAYTRIRPSLGGYLHDNGKLNLERLQVFLREIAHFEVDSFKLEVADHQWYQVYKQKAELRGESPDDSSVVTDTTTGANGRGRGRRGIGFSRRGGGRSHHSAGDVMEDESAFNLPDGFYSALGEATIPIKGGRLVLSRTQQNLIDLIRRFAIRTLPKVAIAGDKVQMQFLPGPVSPLDSLIVAKAAEMLGIHVGREYAFDESMSLYVAAGSPKALAKLDFDDSDESGNGHGIQGSGGYFGSLANDVSDFGALEGSDDDNSSSSDIVGGHSNHQAVPDFVEKVADPNDEAAVTEYVDMCLREFSNVLVVPDTELDLYTQRGDISDFWQRFEIWKANYYKAKTSMYYDIPDVTEDYKRGSSTNSSADGNAEATGSGQVFRPPPAAVEPMCASYIGTLQWVLLYYFQGCPSWSWFYPYHYAPCVSDICANLPAYKVDNFEGGSEPYTPYEQLMCVLPPYSRKLLPAPLRALMVDIHSPIRDLFPTSFSVDMNGKKMPWEAVVLIDFVDIDRIRTAMAPKLDEISEDETRRNGRGKNMAYSYAPLDVEDDDAGAPEYVAPANLAFPSIRPLKCKGIVYVMPSLKARSGQPALRLVQGLAAGSVCRAMMRPGFPSLFTAPHTTHLSFNGTEVFGSPSRDESMMIDLLPNSFDKAASTAEIAQELLNGKRVRGVYRPRRLFVDWPFVKDAVLVGVSDETGVYTISACGSPVMFVEYGSAAERQIWTKNYMEATRKAKMELAVVLPEHRKVLLHVLPLRGLQLHADGSLVRDYGFPSATHGAENQPWADVSSWPAAGVKSYPAGLVLSDLTGAWVNNPRFAEHDALPLEMAFPAGSRVFFLGRTPLYGSPGKVIGHSRNSSGVVVGMDMQLQAGTHPAAVKHENFVGLNALTRFARAGYDVYKPSFAVAREAGVSPLLLSRITSRMVILDESKTGDVGRVQIGLDLKFEGKRLKVSGYTRRAPNGWQFSDRAIDLICRYKTAFPELFARLEQLSNRDTHLTAAECFAPPPHEAQDAATQKAHVASEVKRIRQWIKENIDRSKMALVPIESEILSAHQIDAIVEAHASTRPTARKRVIVRGVHRAAALLPADAQYLLNTQSLMVGHRIIYVSDRSGSVPLGAKGYIVALHTQERAQPLLHTRGNHRAERQHQEGVPASSIRMVEILLDNPFVDGTSLDGRCPPYRGALVRPQQVLDLTTWGLGQSVSSEPSAAPRTIDTIVQTPATTKTARGGAASTTAEVAAKTRARFGRPANASTSNGVISVEVPEPSRAPWASRGRPTVRSTADDNAHAAHIISQLTAGRAAQQASSSSTAPSASTDTGSKVHAQKIIDTLLAGPMSALSIGASSSDTNSGPTSGTTASYLHSHPPVGGQQPLVIEEAYCSDSLDEDDNGGPGVSGTPKQPRRHRNPYNNNADQNQDAGTQARDRGRGRGRGRGGYRGRGRGRGFRGGRGRGGIGFNDKP